MPFFTHVANILLSHIAYPGYLLLEYGMSYNNISLPIIVLGGLHVSKTSVLEIQLENMTRLVMGKRIVKKWEPFPNRPVLPLLDSGGDGETIDGKHFKQHLEWVTPYNMRIM